MFLLFRDSCDFLLNRWLLLAAVIIFFSVITISFAVNLAKKNLPYPLEWLFAILLVSHKLVSSGGQASNLKFDFYLHMYRSKL